MERWKYIIIVATVLSFFITLSASAYNWVSNTFFSSLKISYPKIAMVGAHATIYVFGVVALSSLGFLLELRSRRRKRALEEDERIQRENERIQRENERIQRENEKNEAFENVKAWCDREIHSILEVLRRLNREVEIELQYYSDCKKKKKEYDWNRWDIIAFTCNLLRQTSGLYNLGENLEILEYVKRYPSLLPIAHLQATIRQGLDQIYDSLCKKATGDITKMNKANVLLEDVSEWHVRQLQEYVEHLS